MLSFVVYRNFFCGIVDHADQQRFIAGCQLYNKVAAFIGNSAGGGLAFYGDAHPYEWFVGGRVTDCPGYRELSGLAVTFLYAEQEKKAAANS